MKGRQENKIIKKGKDISEQFKGNGKCDGSLTVEYQKKYSQVA